MILKHCVASVLLCMAVYAFYNIGKTEEEFQMTLGYATFNAVLTGVFIYALYL